MIIHTIIPDRRTLSKGCCAFYCCTILASEMPLRSIHNSTLSLPCSADWLETALLQCILVKGTLALQTTSWGSQLAPQRIQKRLTKTPSCATASEFASPCQGSRAASPGSLVYKEPLAALHLPSRMNPARTGHQRHHSRPRHTVSSRSTCRLLPERLSLMGRHLFSLKCTL